MVNVVPRQLFSPKCCELISPALVVLSCCEIIYFKTWHSGRASDSKSRGPGFDPHMCHRVVSLRKMTGKLMTDDSMTIFLSRLICSSAYYYFSTY